MMYIADASGYLGYVALILVSSAWQSRGFDLNIFNRVAIMILSLAFIAFLGALWFYFKLKTAVEPNEDL